MNETRNFFKEDAERLDVLIKGGCKDAMMTGYGLKHSTDILIRHLADRVEPEGDEISTDEKRLRAMIASAYYLGFSAGKHRSAQNISEK